MPANQPYTISIVRHVEDVASSTASYKAPYSAPTTLGKVRAQAASLLANFFKE
jgi:hypothetical protein